MLGFLLLNIIIKKLLLSSIILMAQTRLEFMPPPRPPPRYAPGLPSCHILQFIQFVMFSGPKRIIKDSLYLFVIHFKQILIDKHRSLIRFDFKYL